MQAVVEMLVGKLAYVEDKLKEKSDVNLMEKLDSHINERKLNKGEVNLEQRSSYLRELVWQPSWQLDNCLIG